MVIFKAVLAQAGLLLAVIHAFYVAQPIQRGRRFVNGALILLALLAAGAFYEFGKYSPWKLDQRNAKFDHTYPYVNRHDFFHYYMGSKYSPEIGYLYLYPAALVVDRENGSWFRRGSIRDQEDYNKWPRVDEVMAEKEKYKGLFTEERWAEFERDILFFRDLMGRGRWQKALRDKGYNATPSWNAVAHELTNRLPADELAGRSVLLWLDMALILAMFGCSYWAFGWRATLFGVVFFGINVMMHETHIKGSLLRMDWVTMLVIAACFLKKGYYVPAGALVGYAAMARVFPAVFAFGLGAKLLWDLVQTRRIPAHYLRFFIAFGIVAGLLFGFSVAKDGGFHRWAKYQELIRMHNADIVGVRAGFKYVFLKTDRQTGSLATYKAQKAEDFEERKLAWYVIQLTVLGASVLFVRRLDDYEALAYGFVPAYFLVAPTFYYYVMLIIPLYLFAPKIHLPMRAIGLAMMFAITIAGYVLYGHHGLNYPTFYYISLMNLGFVLYIMYVASIGPWPSQQEPARDTPGGDAPAPIIVPMPPARS